MRNEEIAVEDKCGGGDVVGDIFLIGLNILVGLPIEKIQNIGEVVFVSVVADA